MPRRHPNGSIAGPSTVPPDPSRTTAVESSAQVQPSYNPYPSPPWMSEGPAMSSHAERTRPVCTFFGTPRGCRNGDSCRFRHGAPRSATNELVASGAPRAADFASVSAAEATSGLGLGHRYAGIVQHRSSGPPLHMKTDKKCRFFGSPSGMFIMVPYYALLGQPNNLNREQAAFEETRASSSTTYLLPLRRLQLLQIAQK